jgi:hypothetical protein
VFRGQNRQFFEHSACASVRGDTVSSTRERNLAPRATMRATSPDANT